MDQRRRPGIRLTEEQHRRLKSEAERAGMTLQSFGQNAVLKAIEESEARRRRRRPEPAPAGVTGLFGGGNATSLLGGLSPRPPAPAPAAPPARPLTGLVEGVSEYVVRGDAATRPARMAVAVDVLRGSARDREQLEAACNELDAVLNVKLRGERVAPSRPEAPAPPRSLTSQMLRGEGG